LPPARHEALPPQPPTPDPPPADASRTIPEPETEEATQAPEADPAAAVPPARPESPSSPQPDYVVTFEKDSNIPSSAALEILNEAANRLQDNPDTFAELSGHADADEDPEAQNLVSESRALAVKSYLIGRGISAGRIRATWHGSDRPASEPDNPVQQRRVEIRLFRGL
jgi:OOP family OmpA-OmpF porin